MIVAEAREATRFDAVYSSEALSTTRLAFLLVRSEAVAEELAQDAFLRLYERFDEVQNPAGFLRTVVVRLAITWLRRHDMEANRLAVVGGQQVAGQRQAGDVTEIDETWEALGRLQPSRRAVLVLRFYEDLPHQEIAELLGCSAATVRSRVRRALNDLRNALDRKETDR